MNWVKKYFAVADTLFITGKQEFQGLMYFAVISEPPDLSKYNFPNTDKWGVVMKKDFPLEILLETKIFIIWKNIRFLRLLRILIF